MEAKRMLPIGVENYEDIRSREYYYVDKTGMIRELLESGGTVNLFTRPRRFGKSLNMSMLKYFFGYGCDPVLFEGLEIAKDRELCERYMGKFPVISVTLKGVEFMNYETARAALCSVVGGDAKGVEEGFGAFLSRTISIRDSWAPKGRKENFYHGVLLGLLGHREDWAIFSNVESGDGFSDILIESGDGELGIVIEVKYPDGGDLEKGCQEALKQIERMGYEEKLRQDDIEKVLKYGIACNWRRCRVVVQK